MPADEFDTFYRTTAPRLLRYAYGLTIDAAQARDLVREAYARAWRRWRRLRRYEDPEGWLRLVVTRLATVWWRRARPEAGAAARLAGPVDPPDETILLMVGAMRSLPAVQRRVLTLHHLLDRSIAQVVAETGATEVAVKSWLSNGRTALSEFLRSHRDDRSPTPSSGTPMFADLDLKPEELGRWYGALRTYAARIPPGTPEGARRRSRQRRHRFVATATTVAVLGAACTTGVVWLDRDPSPPPVEPLSRPTVTFIPLRPAGSIQIAHSFTRPVVKSAIVDEIAYVLSGGSETATFVGALDLASGTPVFPTVRLHPMLTVDAFVASPAGVLIAGESSDQALNGSTTVTILDPRNGTKRWQRAMGNGQVITFHDAVVVYDKGTMRLAALDWANGNELWSRLVDATLAAMPVEPDAPPLPALFGAHGVDAADHRLVTSSSDGHVEIIDVRTGESLRHISVGQVATIRPIGDSIYTTAGPEVWAWPLDSSAPPPTRVRVGQGAERFTVSSCGAGLVCLFSDLSFSVIVLDSSTHEELFRQLRQITIRVVGDRLLTTDGRVWDLNGRQLAGSLGDGAAQNHAAWWLTPGSVLRLRVTFPSPTNWPTVEGVWTADGTRLDLGQIPTLDGSTACAADLQYLVCPAADGFHAWQFGMA